MPNDNERVPLTKAQVTLYSAVVGFMAVVISLTLWASSIKGEAHEAKTEVDCLTPRVTAVEQRAQMLDTRGNERWDTVIKTFQQMQATDKEMQADVKEILRRLPK